MRCFQNGKEQIDMNGVKRERDADCFSRFRVGNDPKMSLVPSGKYDTLGTMHKLL